MNLQSLLVGLVLGILIGASLVGVPSPCYTALPAIVK